MGVIIHNGVNYTRKAYEPKKPPLVSWSTGTDDEIVAMVNGYYDGILSIDDIKSVWSLGDSRLVELSAMPATYVSESHKVQTVELMIIDFEHDDLVDSINQKTKSLITINQKNCLNGFFPQTSGNKNTEDGYMNSIMSNAGGWNSSKRRMWCNEIYIGSLPVYIRNIIKQVQKPTSAGGQSSTITLSNDYIFLLSGDEIYGKNRYTYDGEGIKYPYFVDSESRIKLPKTAAVGGNYYYTRSPNKGAANGFAILTNTGLIEGGGVSYLVEGIAPAFCL